MQRRSLIAIGGITLIAPAWAHHGWSSFDTDRPLFLEGTVAKVAWRNPHAEFDLKLRADLKLPADLAQRTVPAQAAQIDGPRLLSAAQLPKRKDPVWHIELAPLTRLEAWRVAELKVGDAVSLVGYTFAGEKGEPVLRAEYLFAQGKVFGLRSAPA